MTVVWLRDKLLSSKTDEDEIFHVRGELNLFTEEWKTRQAATGPSDSKAVKLSSHQEKQRTTWELSQDEIQKRRYLAVQQARAIRQTVDPVDYEWSATDSDSEETDVSFSYHCAKELCKMSKEELLVAVDRYQALCDDDEKDAAAAASAGQKDKKEEEMELEDLRRAALGRLLDLSAEHLELMMEKDKMKARLDAIHAAEGVSEDRDEKQREKGVNRAETSEGEEDALMPRGARVAQAPPHPHYRQFVPPPSAGVDDAGEDEHAGEHLIRMLMQRAQEGEQGSMEMMPLDHSGMPPFGEEELAHFLMGMRGGNRRLGHDDDDDDWQDDDWQDDDDDDDWMQMDEENYPAERRRHWRHRWGVGEGDANDDEWEDEDEEDGVGREESSEDDEANYLFEAELMENLEALAAEYGVSAEMVATIEQESEEKKKKAKEEKRTRRAQEKEMQQQSNHHNITEEMVAAMMAAARGSSKAPHQPLRKEKKRRPVNGRTTLVEEVRDDENNDDDDEEPSRDALNRRKKNSKNHTTRNSSDDEEWEDAEDEDENEDEEWEDEGEMEEEEEGYPGEAVKGGEQPSKPGPGQQWWKELLDDERK